MYFRGWICISCGFNGRVINAITSRNMIERQPIVRWLLENGADPNMFSTGSRAPETPLEAAANRSSIGVVELLLYHGVMLQDSYPLHFAATRPEVEDESAVAMMDFLLGRGVSMDELRFERHPERLRENGEGATALHWAARGRWLGRVGWLVERGADVCKKSSKGKSPLDWARLTRKSNTEVVELLEKALKEREKSTR
jgi:ankyrin repeat protein